MRYNSAAFVEVVKEANNMDWEMLRSPDTLWVLLAGFAYSLKHSLGILDFKPIWSCLIIDVLAIRAKFLKPSGYLLICDQLRLHLSHN